jgi:hypothetical protein
LPFGVSLKQGSQFGEDKNDLSLIEADYGTVGRNSDIVGSGQKRSASFDNNLMFDDDFEYSPRDELL